MSCENRVSYMVPKGYGYKELDYKCGSTGIDGEAVLCDECSSKVESGQMARPGYCIHGVRLTEYDCDCVRCELGDDEPEERIDAGNVRTIPQALEVISTAQYHKDQGALYELQDTIQQWLVDEETKTALLSLIESTVQILDDMDNL